MSKHSPDSLNETDIAIIGMSCRFPGADNPDAFWQNLRDGVESISVFSDRELLSSGVDSDLLSHPNYVKAGGILPDIELFDAAFFDISAREAEILDPQQRLFLENAWTALESAGYDAKTYSGSIGVYAGVGMNTYLLHNLYANLNSPDLAAAFQLAIANDKDFLPTRISYKLNLKGPSVNVQTACSTSLVAVHLACQSLLNGECDIALAGGVSIRIPQKVGYLYQEGMILSSDGHCRAFDAQAQGTIGSSGLGIVVLKRLEDAVVDGDCIHAVIKGSAINNDGAVKVGYTAPSVDGQAAAIAEAQAIAGVAAETVTYIEAHGTGTPLGDPIEIAALTQAFATSTQHNFCAIGSVKTNFGHLDAAAGVASLIKAVLALKHKQIPPSLHFEQPNPKIDFANSPFYVNTQLQEWKTNGTPRRAGVSSFGIGGTNAHVVVEEAPRESQKSKVKSQNFQDTGERPCHLLCLSAKTASALEKASANLANYLEQHPQINLADVAYTLAIGRQAFDYRRTVVVRDAKDAVTALNSTAPAPVVRLDGSTQQPSVAFLFPGQGTQYVNMGRQVYETEPRFRQQVDECCEMLQPLLGLDLRSILYPHKSQIPTATAQLQQTALTQPAIFAIEYALAQLWMSWGVRPVAAIGHSIGEYVAATIAGVFSLEEALSLVVARGQLMQQLPAGKMLAVPLAEAQVLPLLDEHLSLAAVNAPCSCVVSGTGEAIDRLQQHLSAQGVESRVLHTSHAFHSPMMEAVLAPFGQRVEQVRLQVPQIPFLSNVTGTWIATEMATAPSYWVKHLRHTVRFAEGLQQLMQPPGQILLEVGAGTSLSTLARRQAQVSKPVVLSSLRHPQQPQSDLMLLFESLGQLWFQGVEVDWQEFYRHQQRSRLPLPTYPFERQRFWVEPQQPERNNRATQSSLTKQPDIADWFYLPIWKQSVSLPQPDREDFASKTCNLVFIDECGLGEALVKRLRQQGQVAIAVCVGAQFEQLEENVFAVNPQQPQDYEALLQALHARQQFPDSIIHLWTIAPHTQIALDAQTVDSAQVTGFYSLLFLAQALGKQNLGDRLQLAVVSNHLHGVTAEEIVSPEKATVLAAVKIIGQEYPNIRCRSIDVMIPDAGRWQERLIDRLLEELTDTFADVAIAYRKEQRWLQTFEPVRLPEPSDKIAKLRTGGVYLITGGLGNIGLVLAEYLAQSVQAKLILTGRSVFPAKDEWETWLATHDEDDEISGKIRKIQQLEALGAEVMVAAADVANIDQMQAVIERAEAQFDRLNGVIHAAGITEGNSFSTLDRISKINCEQQFQSKIYGLLVLEKVLQGRKLDFCLLMSSLSSVLGGLGYTPYAAANLFIDTFVRQHNQRYSDSWMSVNWDGWQFEEAQKNRTTSSSLAEFAIGSTEGIEVFQRILSWSTSEQVVVSTGNLQSRIEQWINPDLLQVKDTASTNTSSSLHSKPNLQNAYVAPRNAIEQKLAKIWQELLGFEQIGIHDNFFDLGGDSLLTVQVRSKLQTTFDRDISLTDLFEYPTINALAQLLDREQTENSDFQQVHSRAKKQKEVMEGQTQLMKLRRKSYE
ncbi:MAG: hypothetical protein N4J56_001852 [Chroococcidiopsis sp. SAG 2025]|uniref:type I polyketide synthase n=1 Tax=Chroococcidiopsis sp. SAG 2025 TaxID=171389 RepID=UPI002936D68B|nr:SDR family oxidoreductase [Chroococcidiopsis sp. SAG 2025]MDV2992198.1 hypothetical protein [Chroococcidiopsis sp. SAG 2025]